MDVSEQCEGKAGHWSIFDGRIERSYPKKSFTLTDNVRDLKVIRHNAAVAAVAGREGLPRAAAGAVLGFLIAGPLGTAIGAGAGAAGSGGGHEGSPESYTILLTFQSFEFLMGTVSSFELEQLQQYLKPDKDLIPNLTPKAQSLEQKQTHAIAAPKAQPLAIKGRTAKRKTFPMHKFTKQLGKPPTSSGGILFMKHLQFVLDTICTIKWRHYDTPELPDVVIVEGALIALSATCYQIRQISSLSDTEGQVLTELFKYLVPFVQETDIRKAWSKPRPSSVVTKSGAFKILQRYEPRRQDNTLASDKVSDSVVKSRPQSRVRSLEGKLATLAELLHKDVITKKEHDAARAKALSL